MERDLLDHHLRGTITSPTNGGSITYDVTAAAGGTVDFSVDITNGSGCTSTLTQSVNVNPVPAVSVSATPDPVCSVGSVSVTVTRTDSGLNGDWSVTVTDGTTPQTAANVSGASTTFTFTARSARRR